MEKNGENIYGVKKKKIQGAKNKVGNEKRRDKE